MALPGFRNHPKFRRLVAALAAFGITEAHVLGLVEMMWEVCYENGEAVLGDSVDVELAAGWAGEAGVLCKALAECGGKTRKGLIEEIEPGVWAVHDLSDHAPKYVELRQKRVQERAKDKVCVRCGDPFRSSDARSRFCGETCRKADYRDRHKDGLVPDCPDQVPDYPGQVTDVPITTSPAQPSPGSRTTTTSSPSGDAAAAPPAESRAPRGRSYGLVLSSMPPGIRGEFLRAWEGYPIEAWNFDTKSMASRRRNQEGTAKRFMEILEHNRIATPWADRLTAKDLADITLFFVAARKSHAVHRSEQLNVPAIENFYNTVEGPKANHWQNAASAWLTSSAAGAGVGVAPPAPVAPVSQAGPSRPTHAHEASHA